MVVDVSCSFIEVVIALIVFAALLRILQSSTVTMTKQEPNRVISSERNLDAYDVDEVRPQRSSTARSAEISGSTDQRPRRSHEWIDEFESTQPHMNGSNRRGNGHRSACPSIYRYPPQTYSEWPRHVQYSEWRQQPNSTHYAGTQASRVGHGNQFIQPPDNGHEELTRLRFSNSIDSDGKRREVYVECIFRLTSSFSQGSSSVVVALEKVDFGIDRACLRHADAGQCDSSCNPLFINKIILHGTPADVEDLDRLALHVEPVEVTPKFTKNNFRQFNVTLGGTSRPWASSAGVQVGHSLTREFLAFTLQARKNETAASWIWTLSRFDNGKKMKFRAVNFGRSPKLAIRPNHMPLGDKDKYSCLAKATWRTQGTWQWDFDMRVEVDIAAMRKTPFSYSLRHVGTLRLFQDPKKRMHFGGGPTTDVAHLGHEFAARLMADLNK